MPSIVIRGSNINAEEHPTRNGYNGKKQDAAMEMICGGLNIDTWRSFRCTDPIPGKVTSMGQASMNKNSVLSQRGDATKESTSHIDDSRTSPIMVAAIESVPSRYTSKLHSSPVSVASQRQAQFVQGAVGGSSGTSKVEYQQGKYLHTQSDEDNAPPIDEARQLLLLRNSVCNYPVQTFKSDQKEQVDNETVKSGTCPCLSDKSRKANKKKAKVESSNCPGERISKRSEKIFDSRLEELTKFKEQFGHCNVPLKYPSLGFWCARVRKSYKDLQEGKPKSEYSMPLNEKRIERLEDMGFQWFGKKTFEQRLEELRTFKERQGHCKVPVKGYGSLRFWCYRIRVAYKNMKNGEPQPRDFKLNPERIRILEEMGFQM